MTCIAPILAAKVLGEKGLKITLGKHGDNFPFCSSIDVASSFGNQMEELDVKGVCVDWKNMIVTTPLYMQADASPADVFDGTSIFIRKITSLVQ